MPKRGNRSREAMLGLHSLCLFDLIFIHETGESKPKCAVKPQTHVQRRYSAVVSTRPQVCQEASLEGSGQAQQAPWVLCFNHRKVMTVPFFPICQASKGMKRIHILQEAGKKKKSQLLGKFLICQRHWQTCQGKSSGQPTSAYRVFCQSAHPS